MQRGFTLIEAIIYVALLSIIMGGVLASVYNLTEGAARVNSNTTLQNEGNFVLRKIDWALSGVSSINTPASGNSNTLSVTKVGGTQVDVRLQGTKVEMREGGGAGTYLPLTTDNVKVTALQFQFIPGTGTGAPDGIEATITINGTVFDTKKYVRK